MAKQGLSGQPTAQGGVDEIEIGKRLRLARTEQGIGLRELARRLEISASALSQIETGKSQPSVKTLYAIVSELGLSLDKLFSGASEDPGPTVQRAESRPTLVLDSGVTWDRLAVDGDRDVDFLHFTYQPGGSSSAIDSPVSHGGREYGLVLSGELELSIGGKSYLLGPRDSCSFDSGEPHRLSNPGEIPTTAVWIVVKHGEG